MKRGIHRIGVVALAALLTGWLSQGILVSEPTMRLPKAEVVTAEIAAEKEPSQ